MHEPSFEWQYEGDGVSSYYVSRAEGIMIVNKNLFKAWWFDYEYNGAFIPRADWHDVTCQSPHCRIFLPVKELCRHFDGHNFSAYSYENRDITPLEIPNGFWDDDIKIRKSAAMKELRAYVRAYVSLSGYTGSTRAIVMHEAKKWVLDNHPNIKVINDY